MASMTLHQAFYEVTCPDCTLVWPRITRAEEVGALWCSGQRAPLKVGAAAAEDAASKRLKQGEAMVKRLATGGPLQADQISGQASSKRGSGRGLVPRAGGVARSGPHTLVADMADRVAHTAGDAVVDPSALSRGPQELQSLPALRERPDLDMDDDFEDGSSIASIEEMESAFQCKEREEGRRCDGDASVGGLADDASARSSDVVVERLVGGH